MNIKAKKQQIVTKMVKDEKSDHHINGVTKMLKRWDNNIKSGTKQLIIVKSKQKMDRDKIEAGYL